jgi:hypothetical protein
MFVGTSAVVAILNEENLAEDLIARLAKHGGGLSEGQHPQRGSGRVQHQGKRLSAGRGAAISSRRPRHPIFFGAHREYDAIDAGTV